MDWSGLRSDMRHFLGIDHALNHLTRMERQMASVSDALSRLAEQQEAASAAQLVSFSNLQTAVDQLRRSRDLSEEDQKAVDRLSEGFDRMTLDAQRADDSVEAPPATDVPVEDVPADDAPVTDVPAEPTPDAPPAEGDSTTTR